MVNFSLAMLTVQNKKRITTNFERNKERPTGQEQFFHTILYIIIYWLMVILTIHILVVGSSLSVGP